jgi:predicted nucleic acid-binding protein
VGLIYLESCILIYAFEHDQWQGISSRKAISQALGEKHRLAISSLVVMECLVGPLRRGNIPLATSYRRWLERFMLLPLPHEVFLLAAAIRGQNRLKAPDALHLAAAQHHGCLELLTNDDRLSTCAACYARNILVGS